VLLVEHDGESIGVEVCGSGPAVVLLHGSGGNRATWWQQVVDLARDFTVVTVEARGSGRSTDRADQSGPVACAADLEAVRRELGVSSWNVVGHSLGGWTALRYAVTHPATTTSVVLVSSVAGVFPPEVDAFWQEFTRELAARGWPAQELAAPPSLIGHGSPLAHLYQLVGALNTPPSMTSPAARIREFDLQDLSPLTMPVTFVCGERDAIAPPPAVRAAAEAAGAAYLEIAGAGHVPFWEDAAAFNGLLRQLLS
jgi:pimeloyl-ACP methyl ester carboxylesterase